MQLLGEGGTEAYYNNAILITGLTGLITMIPCLYFYEKKASQGENSWRAGNRTETESVKHWRMRTDPGHGSWFCAVCKYVRQYDRFLSQYRGISGDDEPVDGWQEHVFPDRVHGNHSTTCGGDRVPLADLSETPGLYALR